MSTPLQESDTAGAERQEGKTASVTSIETDAQSQSSVEETSPAEFDLSGSEYYLNRELTWLTFNERVLHEAEDPRTPLLERFKFLAISGNL